MNKIEKWLFPFLGSDGKEITDAQRVYAALAQNEDGFYPIGANGLWHGGIHFAAGSGQALKQGAGIRCIADGEVVAYRLNKNYPSVYYPSDRAHPAKYSSGFVLVRHKLVLPPEPPAPVPAGTTPPPAPATPAEPPAADILTFYSLYMHVMNAEAYNAHLVLERPVHWAGPAGDKYKVGTKANEKDEQKYPGKAGVKIYDTHKKAIGFLPQGDVIKLGAALAGHPTYFSVDVAYTGFVYGDDPKASMFAHRALGYVLKSKLDPLREPDPAALDAIYILPTPKPVKAGDLLGHLGEYQNYNDVKLHPSGRPMLHLEVFSGDDVPAFITRSKERAAKLDAKTKNRLNIKAAARLFHPAPSSALAAGVQVIECTDSPKSGRWVKVTRIEAAIVARNTLTDYKAGTGNSKGSYKHSGKRVEFTGRFFGPTDADVTTDATVQKNLGYNRREILKPTGNPLWIERSALASRAARSVWNEFPLQLSKPSGNVTVLSRVYTRAEVDKFATNLHALDDHNVLWIQHNDTSWVCEKDSPHVEWQSSWDWPGFEIVKETSTPADHFVRNPHILNAALPNEGHNFQQRADAADSTGIFKKVRELMDGIDKSRPDGKISVSEFKRALQTPWLADQVGRLIVNNESEWGGAATKWDELDSVMLDGINEWREEKVRIAGLSFWNGMRNLAGFPAPQVYHFHPVGLVGNFVSNLCHQIITLAMLKMARPSISNEYCETILPFLNKYANIYQVNTPLRVANLLAQVGHESGFKVKSEDLDYSARRMREIFGCKKNQKGYDKETDECIVLPRLRPKLWSEESTYAHKAENLGNYVYADRNGNGNEGSGDGYKYRGRGIIQLTGKSNYQRYSDIHNEKNKDDIRDFVESPDLITSNIEYGIESAFVWWEMNDVNGKIDASYAKRTDNDITGHVSDISIIVNGGTNGLADRVELFKKLIDLVKEEMRND